MWTRCGSRIWLLPPDLIGLDSSGQAQPSSATPADAPFFDVERYRTEPGRTVVVRAVASPTLVLGSTQSAEVVSAEAAARAAVAVQRRRGGGGAVLLRPGDHLWLDAWIPRDDPLWVHDVAAATSWVGAWWRVALESFGFDQLTVHHGRAEPAGGLGSLVCFAGHGPGEVFASGRKIVGLSQWRSREGALFSSCAYTRWDPAPLAELLEAGGAKWGSGPGLARSLEAVAVGVFDVAAGLDDLPPLREALLGSFFSLG
jgi:lipoate-protein ligase A